MAKISLALIKLPAWNSRVTNAEVDKSEQAEIQSLAASFKAQGQLQPVEVEALPDGSYVLVMGTRRKAAAHLAGWTDIEANVMPPSSDQNRIIRNLIENVKRKNLTSFEEARGCAEMRRAGLKNGEIANILGFSMQKVSNLGNWFEKLPPQILKEWQKETTPQVATEAFLSEVASDKKYPTPEKKMQRWDERAAEIEEMKAAGRTPGKRGKGKDKDTGGTSGYPVSQKRLGHVIDSLASKRLTPDLSDDVRNWARALIAYVIQGRESPPTGLPPIPKKEKAEKPEKEKASK